MSGRAANSAGLGFEHGIERVLIHATGYPAMQHSDWVRANRPRPAIVKNVPYTNIYGSSRARAEFAVRPVDESLDARIECKWQAVAGSVDEKFPFVFENAREADERFVLVICGGTGARPEAVDWLRRQAGMHSGRRVEVRVFIGTDELAQWLQTEKPWSV